MANNENDVKVGLWKNRDGKDFWSGRNKETGEGFLLFPNRNKKNPKQPDFDLVIKPANPDYESQNQQSNSPSDDDIPF